MALSKMDTDIKIIESQPVKLPTGIIQDNYVVLATVKAAVDHKLKSSYLSSSGGWANMSAIAPIFQTVTFRSIKGLKVTVEHYVEMDGAKYRILGVREHNKMYVEAMIATELTAKGAGYA